MRFNQASFVFCATASMLLPAMQQAALAKPGHLNSNQSTTFIASAPSAKISQVGEANEGRKLSMTVPGLGTAHITVIPIVGKATVLGKPLAAGPQVTLGQPPKTLLKKDLAFETQGNNITVRVPASVHEAFDDAQVVSKQIAQNVGKSVRGINQFVSLLILYFKQWTGNTTITPGGSPYLQTYASPAQPAYPQLPANAIHKLYFTGEGRVKSVVNR